MTSQVKVGSVIADAFHLLHCMHCRADTKELHCGSQVFFNRGNSDQSKSCKITMNGYQARKMNEIRNVIFDYQL